MVDSLKIREANLSILPFHVRRSSAFKDGVGAIFNSSSCSASCNSRNALNDAVRIGGLGSVLLRSGKYMHLPLFRWFKQLFLMDFNT